jgi:hypothetical protein
MDFMEAANVWNSGRDSSITWLFISLPACTFSRMVTNGAERSLQVDDWMDTPLGRGVCYNNSLYVSTVGGDNSYTR